MYLLKDNIKLKSEFQFYKLKQNLKIGNIIIFLIWAMLTLPSIFF
jgi:hypothetical protein